MAITSSAVIQWHQSRRRQNMRPCQHNFKKTTNPSQPSSRELGKLEKLGTEELTANFWPSLRVSPVIFLQRSRGKSPHYLREVSEPKMCLLSRHRWNITPRKGFGNHRGIMLGCQEAFEKNSAKCPRRKRHTERGRERQREREREKEKIERWRERGRVLENEKTANRKHKFRDGLRTSVCLLGRTSNLIGGSSLCLLYDCCPSRSGNKKKKTTISSELKRSALPCQCVTSLRVTLN